MGTFVTAERAQSTRRIEFSSRADGLALRVDPMVEQPVAALLVRRHALGQLQAERRLRAAAQQLARRAVDRAPWIARTRESALSSAPTSGDAPPAAAAAPVGAAIGACSSASFSSVSEWVREKDVVAAVRRSGSDSSRRSRSVCESRTSVAARHAHVHVHVHVHVRVACACARRVCRAWAWARMTPKATPSPRSSHRAQPRR